MSSNSFFFYDLETSGTNPRTARIMQFAGQRTDLDLKPIGEPYNILVKLTEDVLPEPDAILITSITPQKTLSEGITEAEFFKLFSEEIVQEGTIFVGFNNIRFDDEFMRYGLYRNLYDSYEWQWKDGCSRWDILDLTRITRALRPESINWPFAADGKPTNRLELLTSLNGLDHENAHDALNDVHATIAVARLIKQKQPKLYDYLFAKRDKKAVEEFVRAEESFVYVSGKYSSNYEKLAVVAALGVHPKKAGVFVYDLRFDPTKYLELSAEKLADLWRWTKDETAERLPVKVLQYNRCPAIAPLSVIRPQDAERLEIDSKKAEKHHQTLKDSPDFYENIAKAAKILEDEYTQTSLAPSQYSVDGELYNGFFSNQDRTLLSEVHRVRPGALSLYVDKFQDPRLKSLLPLYKARNFPKYLTDEERKVWEDFRLTKLQNTLPGFMKRLQELSQREGLTASQAYILEELQLYAESIMPTEP